MESCYTGSAQVCRQKPEGFCPQLILGTCVLMALGRSLLGQEIEERWWSYLCTQVCRYSWETSSLMMVFVYVALWPRINSGCRRTLEDSCPRMLLGSCVLWVSGCSSEEWGWAYLCYQASPHSWVVSYLSVPPGYGALW